MNLIAMNVITPIMQLKLRMLSLCGKTQKINQRPKKVVYLMIVDCSEMNRESGCRNITEINRESGNRYIT
jgi:hypothetical protein